MCWMCIFSKSDTYCQRLWLNPGGEHLLSGRRGRASKPLLKGSLNQLRGQAAQLKTVTNYAFLFYLKYLAADKMRGQAAQLKAVTILVIILTMHFCSSRMQKIICQSYLLTMADVYSLEMQIYQRGHFKAKRKSSFPRAFVNISLIYWLGNTKTGLLRKHGNSWYINMSLTKVFQETKSFQEIWVWQFYCRNLQIAFEDILTVKPR